MTEVLKWAGLIGAGWFLVSIPVALFLGRVLKGRSEQVPVSDERFALHAVKGGQR